MSLVVPKIYLSKAEEIKNKDAFYQMSLLLWWDSVPSDWVQRIEDLGFQALISPRHDKDVLEDGSAKKPHWHVLFLFQGRKSFKDCQFIADSVSGQPDYPWLYVAERKPCARYECHLDQPTKHRYPISELVSVNGCEIEKLIRKSDDGDDEVDEVLTDIIDFIGGYGIQYFNDLVDYCIKERKSIWLKRLRKDLTPFVKAYMSGVRLKLMDSERIRR